MPPPNPVPWQARAQQEELRLQRANEGEAPVSRPLVSDEDEVVARAEHRRKEREEAERAAAESDARPDRRP